MTRARVTIRVIPIEGEPRLDLKIDSTTDTGRMFLHLGCDGRVERHRLAEAPAWAIRPRELSSIARRVQLA